MLGIMYGAYALGVLASTPIFGVLSDRIGRRKPMLWGFLVQALATLLFVLHGGVSVALLARLLQGVAAAATWTTGSRSWPSSSRSIARKSSASR